LAATTTPLAAEELARWSRHAVICKSCSLEIARWRELDQALAEWSAAGTTAAARLTDNVLARVAAEPNLPPALHAQRALPVLHRHAASGAAALSRAAPSLRAQDAAVREPQPLLTAAELLPTNAAAYAARLLIACAAGFFLAVFLLRAPSDFKSAPSSAAPALTGTPSKALPLATVPPREIPAQSKPGSNFTMSSLATLTLMSGLVTQKAAPEPNWFSCATRDEIQHSDQRVRTEKQSLCEWVSAAGQVEIRFNAETEGTFRAEREFELLAGQIFVRIPSPNGPLGAQEPAHPASSDLQRLPAKGKNSASAIAATPAYTIRCGTLGIIPGQEAILTFREGELKVQTLRGECTLTDQQRNLTLPAGMEIVIRGAEWGNPQPIHDPVFDTRWMHPLLVLKGTSAQAELQARTRHLLAAVGKAKLAYLYEAELRRLGEPGVPPLLALLAEQPSPQGVDERQRGFAAWLVADMAGTAHLPQLIELLADQDPQVRAAMAAALARITGENQGLSPHDWRGDWERCAEPFENWRLWWTEHRHLYPHANQTAIPAQRGRPSDGTSLQKEKPG
jgi:hypothetical protein